MNSSPYIAVILPPREHFREADAGAVALTIRTFYQVSSYKQNTIVFGAFLDHFSEVDYHQVKLSWWKLLGQNFAYAQGCIRDLASNSIRLVEVHNRVKLALRIKSALPHLKVVLHLHNDPQSMDGLQTSAQRQEVLMCLDHFYCVSEFVKTRLIDGVVNELSGKTSVIYNALSADSYEVESTFRQNMIVYAGRVVEPKGVLELAQALAVVLPQFPDWKAVFLGAKGFGHVAGQSKYEQKVYAELKHVDGQVEFCGHVAHAEVLNVFRQARIVVAPSTGVEACPLSPMEAMGAGCAVITSTLGGMAEVAGNAAVLVDPVNKETLAFAIRSLLIDEELRQNCAIKCKQHIRNTFSLSVHTAHLDRIRTKLLSL